MSPNRHIGVGLLLGIVLCPGNILGHIRMGIDLTQCTRMVTFIGLPHLGDQATHTMTWYPTESLYHNTETISPCLILIIPNASLGSGKHQFFKSLVWCVQGSNSKIHQNGRRTFNSFSYPFWSKHYEPSDKKQQQQNLCNTTNPTTCVKLKGRQTTPSGHLVQGKQTAQTPT